MSIKNPQVQLIGERVILKARSILHAEEQFALIDANREHLAKWMPWESSTTKVEDTLRYLAQAEKWWANGEIFDYSLFEKSSGQLIGSFGLHDIDWKNKTAHLGFWISKDFEGKGYVTEALNLVEGAARDLQFHRLMMTCDRLNARSAAVAKRNRFKLEATLIDECEFKGRLRDTLQFVKFLNPPKEGELTENLPSGYSIKQVGSEEFGRVVGDHHARVFDENELILRTQDLLSEKEKDKLRPLQESFNYPFRYNTLLLYKGDLAGWTWGYQDSRESVYMTNSAILPEHRGRKLYSRLLDVTLETLIEKGFQRIWSRHNTTNNSVIVPKLKRGFLITATELSDVFGSLVHLTFFTNSTRRKALDFRAGSLRPDDELRKVFKL